MKVKRRIVLEVESEKGKETYSFPIKERMGWNSLLFQIFEVIGVRISNKVCLEILLTTADEELAFNAMQNITADLSDKKLQIIYDRYKTNDIQFAMLEYFERKNKIKWLKRLSIEGVNKDVQQSALYCLNRKQI